MDDGRLPAFCPDRSSGPGTNRKGRHVISDLTISPTTLVGVPFSAGALGVSPRRLGSIVQPLPEVATSDYRYILIHLPL